MPNRVFRITAHHGDGLLAQHGEWAVQGDTTVTPAVCRGVRRNTLHRDRASAVLSSLVTAFSLVANGSELISQGPAAPMRAVPPAAFLFDDRLRRLGQYMGREPRTTSPRLPLRSLGDSATGCRASRRS
jgi:hypothetical protein